MDAKGIGVGTILSGIILGLIAWSGVQIVSNAKAVTRLEEREMATRDIIIRMRTDFDKRLDSIDSNVDWIRRNLYYKGTPIRGK